MNLLKPINRFTLAALMLVAGSADAAIIVNPNSNGATDVVQDPSGSAVLLTNPLADPLNLGFDLGVGHTSAGELLIDLGSDLSVTGAGFIGNSFFAPGTVTVTGTGSTWNNNGFVRVGLNSGGTLNIENGGSVSNTDAIIGDQSSSTSFATVTGTGSCLGSTTSALCLSAQTATARSTSKLEERPIPTQVLSANRAARQVLSR